jgi:hypothetical protein
MQVFVIPAKAGIQWFSSSLDSCLHGSVGFWDSLLVGRLGSAGPPHPASTPIDSIFSMIREQRLST